MKVEAGRLTDLGSLIPFNIGGYEFVLLPINTAEFSSAVDAPIKEYQSFLSLKTPIVWRTEKTPTPIKKQTPATGLGLIADLLSEYERHVNKPSMNKQLREAESTQEFFRLAKMASAPLTGEPTQDASGNLFYGADLGQIRVRKSTGEWGAIDTGTLHSVTAVEAYGQSIVAGFDNGVIRISDNAGAAWKEVATLGHNVSVIDIDRVGDHWIVLTARHTTDARGWKSVDQMAVHIATRNDFRDIASNRQIDLATPNFFTPQGEVAKGFYYVNTYPDLLRLDVNSMQWNTVTPPTDVSGFHVSPATGVLAAYRVMGTFSKLFISTDNGKSWSKYDNPPYVIVDVRFESKTDGRAVRWSAGLFSGTMEFMRYDHSGDLWNKTSEAPHGCARILPDGNNTEKFCITTGGSILRHSDQQWVAEFSVE